jgi:hypothetical protein
MPRKDLKEMSKEHAKICFDRVLPRDLMRRQLTVRSAGRLRAINPIGKKWVNGSKLRVRFIGGTAAQHGIVKNEADWWAQIANLAFEFNNASAAEIRISFDESDGAWSYIGTDCQGIPLNAATMNLGFQDKGTTAHEFGHAIGLAHEHQNPAGGIQWNEAVVIREMAKSPNYWDEETTRNNILFKYSADQINGTEFDPDSIMLYFFPREWTLNGIGTKANEVLSELDRLFISGAKMYPKAAPTAVEATALEVDAKSGTEASISKFGEEDLFTFVVTHAGRHVVETSGHTDVVMKLFGPNSPTLLIAEDDDSGTGSNARIALNIIEGRYYVQVRHYDPQRGRGKYSVRVRRA